MKNTVPYCIPKIWRKRRKLLPNSYCQSQLSNGSPFFLQLCLWLILPTLPFSRGELELHLLLFHLQSTLITSSSSTNKNFVIVFRGTRRDFQWAKLYRFLSHFNQDVGCTIQYWLCNQKARRNRTQMNYYGKIVLIMGSWSIKIYIYNALSNYIMQGNKLC